MTKLDFRLLFWLAELITSCIIFHEQNCVCCYGEQKPPLCAQGQWCAVGGRLRVPPGWGCYGAWGDTDEVFGLCFSFSSVWRQTWQNFPIYHIFKRQLFHFCFPQVSWSKTTLGSATPGMDASWSTMLSAWMVLLFAGSHGIHGVLNALWAQRELW